MRMSRSTFAHLKDMLSAHMDESPRRRRRRDAMPLDVQMRVALFRLGHDGNSACK